jgi:hypothetical protein
MVVLKVSATADGSSSSPLRFHTKSTCFARRPPLRFLIASKSLAYLTINP